MSRNWVRTTTCLQKIPIQCLSSSVLIVFTGAKILFPSISSWILYIIISHVPSWRENLLITKKEPTWAKWEPRALPFHPFPSSPPSLHPSSALGAKQEPHFEKLSEESWSVKAKVELSFSLSFYLRCQSPGGCSTVQGTNRTWLLSFEQCVMKTLLWLEENQWEKIHAACNRARKLLLWKFS